MHRRVFYESRKVSPYIFRYNILKDETRAIVECSTRHFGIYILQICQFIRKNLFEKVEKIYLQIEIIRVDERQQISKAE